MHQSEAAMPAEAAKSKPEPLLIKRYASRRLYNTETSDYVTLEEIAQVIRDGREVRIVDLRSGDDLTRQYLLQIIAEHESRGESVLPVDLLTDLVRSYTAQAQSVVPQFLAPLLGADRMLASPTKSSPFVNGAVRFEEDREGPPSRAYLKLWEALTRLGRWPGPGETVLDLGAAPGGWTWALAQLGCDVVAVDKAAMDPAVAALPNVSVRTESAFGLEPERQPAVDWLFSDIICYPARLLALVRRWMEAGRARHFCCTIKFQGETDHAVMAEFAAIPGAQVFHGAHNRHEAMFVRLGD